MTYFTSIYIFIYREHTSKISTGEYQACSEKSGFCLKFKEKFIIIIIIINYYYY